MEWRERRKDLSPSVVSRALYWEGTCFRGGDQNSTLAMLPVEGQLDTQGEIVRR